MNDNVLYHSLFVLKSGKRLLVSLVRKWDIPVGVAADDFGVNTSHNAVSGYLPCSLKSGSYFLESGLQIGHFYE
jgi:hypothetical protein